MRYYINKASSVASSCNMFIHVNIFDGFLMSSAVSKFIRIGIADKNDNPPYFDKALYEAEVDENEDIQHTVLTVTAKDHDECEYVDCNIEEDRVDLTCARKY